MITVFMTAFYMFRAIFLTFGGEYRGGAPAEHGGHAPHGPHESTKVMVIPLVILAAFSIISGWFNVTGGFSNFMGHGASHETHGFTSSFFGILTHPIPLISLAVAVLGIFVAYIMYSAKWVSAETIGRTFKPIYTLFYRKYWLDELYEKVIVLKVLVNGIFSALGSFDSRIVDGAVNGLASTTSTASRTLRQAQTGQLQIYAMAIALGIIAIAVCIYIFG
jgi:NADH-quinone oxidoreductase subunit L